MSAQPKEGSPPYTWFEARHGITSKCAGIKHRHLLVESRVHLGVRVLIEVLHRFGVQVAGRGENSWCGGAVH